MVAAGVGTAGADWRLNHRETITMLKIEIQGLDRLQRQLSGLGSELPKAIAAGINRTARAMEQSVLNGMERHLDRPTPFTINSTVILPANQKHLDATLAIRPIQAAYLQTPIMGGDVSGTIVPVVSNARLNQYGNLPGKRRGLEGIKGRNKRRFVGKVGNTRGVFERLPGNRLRAIAFVDRTAPRRKVFPFFEIAEQVAEQRLERNVRAAIDSVLRG